MKKFGIGSRLLAALLALTMFVSLVPLSALAYDGQIYDGVTGLDPDRNIDTKDTISWPIKVYDFLNDGMLFEYASAQDSEVSVQDGGAYGGGEIMPGYIYSQGDVLGVDYTINYSDNDQNDPDDPTQPQDIYDREVYNYWLQEQSDYHSGKAQQGKSTPGAFKFLRLYPYNGDQDVPATVVSDFYNDPTFFCGQSSSYAKSRVRYAAVVYRTNVSGLKLSMGVSDPNGGTVLIDYNGNTATDDNGNGIRYDLGEEVTLTSHEKNWYYAVVDLGAGAAASKWNNGQTVKQILLDTNMSLQSQYLDLSHIAYFSDKGEALRFGERAAAFSNNPGEFLPDQTYVEGSYELTLPATKPSFTYGQDYTTDAAFNNNSYKTMSSSYGMTTKKDTYTNKNGEDRTFMNVSDKTTGRDYSYVATFSSDGYTLPGINSVDWCAMVYRTHNMTNTASLSDRIAFWVNATNSDYGHGAYGNNPDRWSNHWADQSFAVSDGEWTYAVFNLAELDIYDYDDGYDYNDIAQYFSSMGKIQNIGIYFPGFDSGESMDISHLCFFADETSARNFGKQALAYVKGDDTYTVTMGGNGTTQTKHWNMGNNTAFTMLYASSGGGWQNDYTGGTNDWTNGYYSYQIGKHTGTGDWANGVNGYRNTAKNKGYPVPDDIYFYSVSSETSRDMSTFDFGYKLFNTITAEDYAQVMTAGLLQNDLISVKGVDGNTYRIPEYKQSTVEYIALVLSQSLPIGQKDYYGNYNYNFIKGSVSSQFAGEDGKKRDLASALREALGLTLPANGMGNYAVPAAAIGGSYAQTKARQEMLIGPYDKVIKAFKDKGLSFTFFDAAFYLMHNLFVSDSYNQLQDDYNYLVLSKGHVTATDKDAYVFDAGFTTGKGTANSQTAVQYSEANGTISLSTAVGKDLIEYSGGQKTTRYPFMPVQDPEGDYRGSEQYQSNGTPYFAEDGAMSVTDYGSTYATRDYNYVMQANAEFVYHYQDNLFFQFQGDDDVYLFVNGELVMDIGAAHSVTSVIFHMNDYVLQAQKEMSFLKQNYGYRPDVSDEKFEQILNNAVKNGAIKESQKDYYRRWHHLNLIDGENYTIDFYYMERHGWGANMRVATNILMTDPSMITEKKAYQDGAEINYGGIVVANKEGENDTKKNIEYSFSVTNEGANKLYNLTFNDYAMGLTLSPENGLSFHSDAVNGVTVFDARGQRLEASDLLIHVDGYKDEEKTQPISKDIRFEGQQANEQLKQFLRELYSLDGSKENANNKLFSGGGLWRHATVTIRGIYYRMTKDQVKAEEFNNIVFTTANPAVDSELVLNSADTHQVRLIGNAKHIYQWAEHDVYFTREDLVKWLGGSVQIGSGTYTASQINLTTCRKDGTTYDFPDIVVRNDTNLTVNYLKSGTQLFFIKVYRDINSNGKIDENEYVVVPLAVYVTDLNDDAVVLDYGLEAELTGKNGITANDYITVPNLETSYSIMGITQSEPSYLQDISSSELGKRNYNRISFQPVVDENGNNADTIACSDGTFKYTGHDVNDKLFFKPTGFMDEEYTIYIAVTIHEGAAPSKVGTKNDTTTGGYSVNITEEVQMYQKVTVLPASVMYYENDFKGIIYAPGHETTQSGTRDGSSILMQGVDQSTNYGSDQNYQTKDNAQFSGNSMTSIRVTEYGKLANFTFQGTGFEIISRTNAFDSASFVVTVRKDGKVIRTLPVITEFSNAASAVCEHTDKTDPLNIPTNGNNLFSNSKWLRYDRTIYFDNSAAKWEQVNAYAYGDGGTALIGDWPGTGMIHNGKGIYSIQIPEGTSKIIFNDGTNKTSDLVIPMDGSNLFDGSRWWRYEDTTEQNYNFIFFDNTAAQWGQVNAYAYNDNGALIGGWPGTAMTSNGNNIYMIRVPDSAAEIIFNDGVNQTADLVIPTDGSNLFNGESWRRYDDTIAHKYRTVFFDNTSAQWGQVYAYAYDACGALVGSWPGTAMTSNGDGTYFIQVPAVATEIIFTDGSSQTSDLKIPTDGNNLFNGSQWLRYQKTVYFNNTATNWKQVYAYAYGADNNLIGQWPGTQMKNIGNGIYSIQIPDGASEIIFSDGTSQTEDLVIPMDGSNLFDGTQWWSYDAIEARKYRIVFFNNASLNWERLYSYVDGGERWPGVAMNYEGNNIYSARLPEATTKVVFNGSSHNASGHCTKCGTYVGHVYYQDECVKCGQQRLDYYLVGYINGADYGCEGDYENMGQYKFKNGKLTVNFKTDGYVFVKTTGNAGYFMTDGYPGAGVTSSYLYNTTTLGDRANKLHVPGGVELTFTLVENSDGTLMLSYTTSNDDVTDLDKTVYFQNTDGWEYVNVYYWSLTDATMVGWPGERMHLVNSTNSVYEDPIYTFELPADAQYVLFNSCKDAETPGVQSMDLTVPTDNMLYSYSGFNAGWSTYNPGKLTLNFDNSTTKWAKVNIYYWSESNEQMVEWPGEEMTRGADNIFTAAIPSNATKVIFNNGDGAQTGNLTILRNGDTYIYKTEGSGWASQDTVDTARTVYFKNTANWTNLHIHYWDEAMKGDMVNWPGDPMVKQEGDIFKAVIPGSATHVIFNNGDNGLQTVNLRLFEDRDQNLFVYDQVAADIKYTGNWTFYGEDPGEVPETPTTRTVYLINSGNWPTPYAYYWVDGTDGSGWPGIAMTDEGNNRYSIKVPLEMNRIIFNDGNGTQTANLCLEDGVDVYDFAQKHWSSTDDRTRTVYLENNTGWVTPYAHFWKGGADLSSWPGVQMTHVSGNRYKVEVPVVATMIIFDNGSNGAGNQTDDLVLSSGHDLYDLDTESWSSSGAIPEETTRPIYYQNNPQWREVKVYYWSLANDSMIDWPGVEMVCGEDGIYTANIPESAQYVIFTNGENGDINKTVDLAIPVSGANFYSCPASTCGTWESYEPKRVLYFDMGDAGWATPYAYYWSVADQAMVEYPGVPMTHVNGTVYSVTVPAKAELIAFNNGRTGYDEQKTGDLTITNAYDKYTYNTGEWSCTTRTIYFEGSGSSQVWVTYSGDGVTETEKIMIRVRDNIFSCVIPMGVKYVTFEDNGTIVAKDVIVSDDHDLYTANGWEVFDPSAPYRTVVYFKNTNGWEDVYVHYWFADGNETTWPGIRMTFVDDGLYMANIPSNVVNLQFNGGSNDKQTANLTLPAGRDLFTKSKDGNGGSWSKYTKTKSDAIHQVPALRVDGLELGTYEVEIQGMPTYMTDQNGALMKDPVTGTYRIKETYLYLDGIRIYQPLGSSNELYSDTEDNATYRELRNMILEGHAAVASYNYGTDTYTGNVSWTENRNGVGGDMNTQYIGNQLSGIEDYLLLGPNNETYLNGNAQTQAVIFYVKEIPGMKHSLQIAARGIDAGLFLGKASTGVNATLYHGVCIEKTPGKIDYGWRPMDTILSGTEQYYTVDYRDCPYVIDEVTNEKIYQVALFVRSGMVSFTNVKYVGLDLQSSPVGEITDTSKFENGIIHVVKKDSGTIGTTVAEENKVSNNLVSIGAQMSATQWIEDDKQNVVLKYPALSFEDEVFYNVFFTLDGLDEQPVEMGLLMFDTLEEEGTIFDASAVISGVDTIDGMYVARSLGVQAKDLGKTLYFRVFAQMPDGSYVYSKAASYSARQYAKAVLEGDYSADTKALIASMLNYSEAARNYFGGVQTLGDLITEDVNALVSEYRTDLLQPVAKPDATKSGIFAATTTGFIRKAPAVSFDGAFAINYFFTPSTTVQGDMTLYYWNAKDYDGAQVLSADNATGSMVMKPGTQYTAAITDIAAKDLDSTYYVAVVYQSNGQTYCSGVLAYSLAAYCQSKATAAGPISDLAKATAVYGYHAKQLFG